MDESLQVGMLLRGTAGQVVGLNRLVFVCRARNAVSLLSVDKPLASGCSRMPRTFLLTDIAREIAEQHLHAAEECLRSSEMNGLSRGPSEKALELRDRRYSLIAELVEDPVTLAMVATGQGRASAIQLQSSRTGAYKEDIYRILTIYWFYGCDVTALLPRFGARGGKGITRITKRSSTTKRGRPTSNLVLTPTAKIRGVNVSTKDLVRFRRHLQLDWVKKNKTLSETYSNMLAKAYTVTVRTGEGPAPRTIDASLVPTFSQFYYHARRIIEKEGLDRFKVGDHDWSREVANRPGTAADCASGPTDVYDTDKGELKIYVRASWNKRKEGGKPSVIFVIDRASSAIVGFHVFVGAESWARYRVALFSAFVDKFDYLRWLGFDNWEELAAAIGVHDFNRNAFCLSALCNEVFPDRGPMRSKAALEALRRVGVGRTIPPPRRPELKAVVESAIGNFQRLVASIPGGYSRRKGEREKTKAEEAASNATLTLKEVSHVLIAAIADHNEFFDASKKLTAEMIGDGVAPVPYAIFQWALRNVRGNRPTKLSSSEMYFNLLDVRRHSLTTEGVQHRKALFGSEELRAHRLRHLRKRRLYVEVSEDPFDPFHLYWNDEGCIRVLEMREADRTRLSGMETVEDWDWYNIYERAGENSRVIRRRNKATVRLAVEKALEDSAAHAPLAVEPTESKRTGAKRQRRWLAEHEREASRASLKEVIAQGAFETQTDTANCSIGATPSDTRDGDKEAVSFKRTYRQPE